MPIMFTVPQDLFMQYVMLKSNEHIYGGGGSLNHEFSPYIDCIYSTKCIVDVSSGEEKSFFDPREDLTGYAYVAKHRENRAKTIAFILSFVFIIRNRTFPCRLCSCVKLPAESNSCCTSGLMQFRLCFPPIV